MTEDGPAWNPYLDEWLRLHGPIYNYWCREDARYAAQAEMPVEERVASIGDRYAAREFMIAKYAFAVPGPHALEAIARLGPVVEMGAGTGYWAACLRALGVDVVAYDEMGEKWERWFRPREMRAVGPYPTVVEIEGVEPCLWAPIERGAPEKLVSHGDRTLLLVWPFMDAMAADSLRAYPGRHVVYVGEGEGGCTGSNEFFEMLNEDWEEVEAVAIPQWDGLHDSLAIWRRR